MMAGSVSIYINFSQEMPRYLAFPFLIPINLLPFVSFLPLHFKYALLWTYRPLLRSLTPVHDPVFRHALLITAGEVPGESFHGTVRLHYPVSSKHKEKTGKVRT